MKHLKIYDPKMNFVGILENATSKHYQLKLNDICTAGFSLPANDPKVKLCIPYRIIELFDNDKRVGLFRILPSAYVFNESEEIITYECEHILATLLDDILFQYHESINLSSRNVIEYILSHQTQAKWVLGNIDLEYFYSYKWESENLLGALFSLTEPFVDDYQWSWDTTTIPWVLNLNKLGDEVKTHIRYGKNMVGIDKTTDPTSLCTRLYGLGYGEGVNQLTIKEVNNNLPYIDADTIDQYGIISRIYTDLKEENAETLKAKMTALLEKVKVPRISYTVKAAHLSSITNNSIDDFYLGAYCKTIDKDENLTFTSCIVSISKGDIDGAPGEIEIEISNSPEDIASSIGKLANRQRIQEVYAQGSTNILAQDFADNADADNPAIVKFFIPEETVRINTMQLNFKTTKFRAYSKAIAGGGALSTTTAAGGGTVESSDPGLWTLYPPQYLLGDFMNYSGAHSIHISGETSEDGDPVHSHSFSDSDFVGGHAHSMYSVAHTHDVVIPNHYHILYIPNHVHDIDYGIFLNPNMPSSIRLYVDGNEVPNVSLNENKLDLIPFLSTDDNGKIKRGEWHEILIQPNNLARIEANIVTQLFIQSRRGGDY